MWHKMFYWNWITICSMNMVLEAPPTFFWVGPANFSRQPFSLTKHHQLLDAGYYFLWRVIIIIFHGKDTLFHFGSGAVKSLPVVLHACLKQKKYTVSHSLWLLNPGNVRRFGFWHWASLSLKIKTVKAGIKTLLHVVIQRMKNIVGYYWKSVTYIKRERWQLFIESLQVPETCAWVLI